MTLNIEEGSQAYHATKRFDEVIQSLDRRLRQFCLVLLSILVSVVVLNVVMRYVFSESLLWANELSRYLMTWFALLMTASLVNSDDHLNVAIVYDKFSKQTQYRLQSATMLLYVFAGLIWTNFGIQYCLEAGLRATAPALEFQMIWVYMIIPITGALVTLFSGARFIRLVIFGQTETLETHYTEADGEGSQHD
ncbi:TRAP transporter small permease [Haloarcula nitratireducens]|uniref:TRAP transporter small permease n=1 Tax=Haloarcula nitratireducens TaxID=2487749 RepID=UPI001C734943|nr:TRAP transporter small permease [Halomicroarcula nitratireducens]